MSRRAFTLMELLMVVIIVGILAAAALPQFGKTMERSYQRQAWDMLQTIYAGEQVYRSTNGAYYDPVAGGNDQAAWNKIYMDNPTTSTTAYTFPSAGPATFTARAQRTGGTTCNNATMTINQARTRSFSVGTTNWASCPMAL